MTKKIAIHSYRGGTGKSNLSANVAVALAMTGLKVGVIDTDIQSPGINVLFGCEQFDSKTLNDYLWGECSIEEAVIDVSAKLGKSITGSIYLLPSSLEIAKLTRILKEGYDVSVLNDGFLKMSERYELDYLVVDTHPGLNEETLLSLAIADTSLVVLRPDSQDYLGTSVTVDVARRLDVKDLRLVLNMLPPSFDEKQVAEKVETTYECTLAAIFGNYDDIRCMGSTGLPVIKVPSSEFSTRVKALAEAIR